MTNTHEIFCPAPLAAVLPRLRWRSWFVPAPVGWVWSWFSPVAVWSPSFGSASQLFRGRWS